MNLDAYTIRKIAPRLLFAVIGVNLSIYLCVAAVDITSVVGHGLIRLIRAPFDIGGGLDSTIDAGSANVASPLLAVGVLAGIVALKGASGAAMSTIFFLLLPVFVLILTTLITIVLRQALLVILTLVSPVAIVLAVLPGTEKYFKQWWDLFLKTLIVYPIIAALFAVSDVLASISFNASNLGGNATGAANVIGGILFAFMPLVLIPFAFRFAGGALGAFTNATNGLRSAVNRYSMGRLQKNFTEGLETVRGEGLFSNFKTRDTGEYVKNKDGSYAKDKDGNKIMKKEKYGVRHRLNQASARMANLDKMRAGRIRGSLNTATEQAIMRRAAAVNESEAGKMLAGFDDELYVAATSDGTKNGIEKSLIAREPERYDYTAQNVSEAVRAERKANVNKSRNMIQDYLKVSGGTAGKAAAAVALHGVSTSYKAQHFKLKKAGSDEIATDSEGNQLIWKKGDDEDLESKVVAKSSHDQMQETIAHVSGGNRGLGNWILGESIKGAKQAGRYDMAASASAVLLYQEAMRGGNEQTLADAKKYYEKMVRERVTPAQASQGHPRAAAEVADAWRNQVDTLGKEMLQVNPKDTAAVEAKKSELINMMADIAGFQDALPSSAKEATDNFQRLLSHKVAGTRPGEQESTVEELIRSVRDTPQFSQRRREWSTKDEGEHAMAEAAGREAMEKMTKPPEPEI